MRERLEELLSRYFGIGDSYVYHLTRDKEAFSIGTMGFDDFVEFDEDTISDLAEFLLKNGASI